MDGAIVVRDLTRRFGDLTAVDGLTFAVEPGEVFGLVAPDGGGKTTTIRMLAAVLAPTSGDATVAGFSVVTQPDLVRPHIAYMAQRFGLYEDLTVLENLHFYADLYRVPAAERGPRLERLFAFSNLGPFQQRLAGQLSGGMKQKLALSCALVHRPRVLLLDEPTFGVDPISRRELWAILEEMVHDGVTILVSTAYMDEADRCHRVAILSEGRILALDRPAALRASNEGDVVAVRADDPRRARDLLRALPAVRRAALFGETVHAVLRPGADPAQLTTALEAEGMVVRDARRIVASLEDVFIDRLGAVSAGASGQAGQAGSPEAPYAPGSGGGPG
jgi:ABC-2 type transport system ATP-binding protein